MNRKGCFLIAETGFHAPIIRKKGRIGAEIQKFILPAHGNVSILSNLAQPDRYFTLAIKGIQFLQCLIESFLRYFFCYRFVSAQR
jgi:hypothetical protein